MADEAKADCPTAFRGEARRPRKKAAAALGWVGCLFLFWVLPDVAGNSGWGRPESKDKLLFLVARPQIVDPLFQRSVVLLLPSNQMPLVVGLIVNKPSRIPLLRLYPESPALKNHAANAYFGGPVDIESPSLVFHAPKPPSHAIPLFGDVYLTFDPQFVSTFLQDPKKTGGVRLFLGRAQWLPEQLQGEMLRGSWYSIRAEGDLILDPDSEHLWRRLHQRAEPPLEVENLITAPSPVQLDEAP